MSSLGSGCRCRIENYSSRQHITYHDTLCLILMRNVLCIACILLYTISENQFYNNIDTNSNTSNYSYNGHVRFLQIISLEINLLCVQHLIYMSQILSAFWNSLMFRNIYITIAYHIYQEVKYYNNFFKVQRKIFSRRYHIKENHINVWFSWM